MGLLYEAFDEVRADAAPGPSLEWAAGHDAGLTQGLATGIAQGTEATEALSGTLSAELSQALADTAFGYAEARGQILASLGPLFQVLIDRLLPALAAEALTPWLAEALQEAAREDSARPLVIHVHPDRIEALRACLPGDGPAGFFGPARLLADSSLGLHDARLERPDRETALDLGACLATLSETLRAISGSLRATPEDPARKARHA